jgi:hypothetical protein
LLRRIPRKPGDRVKTNRRDAIQLARLLRAGELTEVWVPDEAHEAIRELIRSREAAGHDLRRKRQAISSLTLRYGRSYPGKKTWGARHHQWLQAQRFRHPAQQLVLQEIILAAQHAQERLQRIEAAIVELVPTWSLAYRGRSIASLARHPTDQCGHHYGRTVIFVASRIRVSSWVISAWCPVTLDWDISPPPRYYQGWQRKGAAHADRKRLVVSASAENQQAQALRSRTGVTGGAGPCHEGANAPVCTIQISCWT